MTLGTLLNGMKIVEVRISFTVLKHGAKIHTTMTCQVYCFGGR